VFESLTGLEYLEMVAALYAIPQEAALERIRQFIAFFDLSFETLTDKLLGAYSKGMRRKVVITAALLHNPPVVFFDEPLDGLDANAAVGFKALIQTLAREGKTIVYSSHILDVVERVCDRVIIIDKGRLLVDGKPEELVASHNSGTLERLFSQLTGGTELEQRAEDFAKRRFVHEHSATIRRKDSAPAFSHVVPARPQLAGHAERAGAEINRLKAGSHTSVLCGLRLDGIVLSRTAGVHAFTLLARNDFRFSRDVCRRFGGRGAV